MSVVTHQARRRWAAVVAGLGVLAAAPAATSAASSWAVAATSDDGPAPAPSVLVARALASTAVPHSGLAESRGNLGLPDLPRLGDVAARVGGVTRTRVWWAGPTAWRVDVLAATGEQGVYGDGSRTVLWDYERGRLTDVTGAPRVRLPRADDLLPPQAARRLLGGLGPADRLQPLPGRRTVAGRSAPGVRVLPADARSSIGHIDVWLDPVEGLPVEIDVVDTHGVTAMQSRFTTLDLAPPDRSVVTVPAAPGVVHDSTTEPDLVGRIQRTGAWRLPGSLAGLPSSEPIVGGTASYGSGLVRILVLPISPRLAGQTLTAVRSGGGTPLGLPGGEALLVSSGVLDLVVARGSDGQHAYLIAGLVSAQVVTAAARELLASPPPRRSA
jgi:hypothetical protein